MQIRARGIHSFGYHGLNPFVFTPRRGIKVTAQSLKTRQQNGPKLEILQTAIRYMFDY